MATRLKVDKSILLSKLRVERERIVATHARKVEAYQSECETFGKRLDEEVRKFLVRLRKNPKRAMELVEHNYSRGAYVTFKNLKRPDEPNLDTRKLDRLIRTLEAATDTVIPVSADDDFAAYL